MFRLSF
jgi:cytosolic carboxypeptidase protein 2/3